MRVKSNFIESVVDLRSRKAERNEVRFLRQSEDRLEKLIMELGDLKLTIAEYETSAKLHESTSGPATFLPSYFYI